MTWREKARRADWRNTHFHDYDAGWTAGHIERNDPPRDISGAPAAWQRGYADGRAGRRMEEQGK